MMQKTPGERFEDLLQVMARLRGENGCPWDREQTHRSLKPFLTEESYELLEAIDREDSDKIREELGDVLHQIVFHAQIAAEAGAFDAADVIAALTEKMIRRHPHVFSGAAEKDSGAVIKRWAELKARERGPDEPQSALGQLPKSMPALARAQAVAERASRVGFDWASIDPVWEKVEEELGELKRACASGSQERARAEIGDLLFSLVNLARFLDVSAEDALSRTIERFLARFSYIESKLQERGKTPTTSSVEEMETLWQEAKRIETGIET
ncbi:MAG TPA: nucleoside triphosphate pyrophosphohydrolase [Candidatus Eisenbacteria bacterium]|nr:nucleoside triphosphate pyrophosphohydrolase [Candidatus Eisenbacteria bacterium]